MSSERLPTALPWRIVLTMTLLVLSCASLVRGQDNYEIQVYPADLVPARKTLVEFHSNFTFSGQRGPMDGTQPSDHAFHETLEVTHGFTGWFEVGGYLFTSARQGDGWQVVGSHIRPRFTVPESWGWPVGFSVSQEIGYQRRYFSADTWTWEIRPIVDQKRGVLYWSVNVAFAKALRGENQGSGFDVSAAAKVSVDVSKEVALGAEYYGGLGSVRHVTLERQAHQIYPTIDLNVSPRWEFNFGVGIGLTNAADGLVVKMIVGRQLPF